MVEHTQLIRREEPTNCLRVFDHFVELALEGLTLNTDETLNGPGNHYSKCH